MILEIAVSLFLAVPLAHTPLHVEGNRLVEDGKTVVLRGVNVPSLEWSNEGENVFRSCRVALEDWHANCIRLPLSQDRWFGKAAGQKDKGADYKNTIADIVSYVTKSGGYVILDLHWSDGGIWGQNIGQHNMPDANSEPFWKEVAHSYRGNDKALFGLYNEPHDVDWKTWKSGGTVTEKTLSYQAVGMDRLKEIVRSMGAKNVLVVGGLDWAYDLTGVLSGFALDDSGGRGIMYDSHIYPWKTDWDHNVGAVASKAPVLIGEVGCLPDPKQEAPETWAPKVLDWIRSHDLSWTAWCLHPKATPNLISDWKYTPTPFWGTYVKAALAPKN